MRRPLSQPCHGRGVCGAGEFQLVGLDQEKRRSKIAFRRNRKPAISSLRRNLQRSYLQRMSALALGYTYAPADCQTVAFAELGRLKTRIDSMLTGQAKLDTYSKAHLEETSSRITKVMDAKMLTSP